MIDYGYGVSLTADIPHLARHWRNQPEIFRWCRQASLISWDAHAAWDDNLHKDTRVKMFGIKTTLPSDDKDELMEVGVCGLTNIDWIARHAEFSLYIAPKFQRLGLGTKALMTLCRHGFEAFNFHKIWGESFEGNPAIEMFKTLGFEITPGHTHHYFKDGQYVNTYFANLFEDRFRTLAWAQ